MYKIQQRIYASHIDERGKLKFASAIDFMQDCSQMWLESEPVFKEYFRQHDIIQILISRQVDILRMPSYGEHLEVRTNVFEIKGFYGYRNTAIYDLSNNPCILSWSMGAFVNLNTGKLVRLPDDITASLTIDEKIDMTYLDRKISLSSDKMTEHLPIPVYRNDIDFNKHMNNARYVQVVAELLPELFSIHRMRVEYKIPAKLGDMLHPLTLCNDDMINIHLVNEESKPYAIFEFYGKMTADKNS